MIPDFQSTMLPLLQQLADGKEHHINEVIDALSDYFHLTEDERNEMTPSQRQSTIRNRIQWANTYMKKAGLIEALHKRGLIRISQRGADVLAQKPAKINVAFLNQFPEFVEFHKAKSSPTAASPELVKEDQEQDPFAAIQSAQQTIRTALADDLLETIATKDPYFFEWLVVELLVKMGYSNEKSASFVTKKSGDNGVDGIIKMDKLGFDLIGVQAKHWDRNKLVGRPEIQGFAGALGGLGIKNGAFFTTSGFTKAAREYNHPGIKIILIDRDELARLMIDYNVGVQTEHTIELKKIDIDFFDAF